MRQFLVSEKLFIAISELPYTAGLVIEYIMKHMDRYNMLEMTEKEIAKEIYACRSTVSSMVKSLHILNIVHHRRGIIMMNPDICRIAGETNTHKRYVDTKYDTFCRNEK